MSRTKKFENSISMCNYPFLLLLRWQEWRKRIFDLNNGLYSDLKFIPKSIARKTISIFVKTISNLVRIISNVI